MPAWNPRGTATYVNADRYGRTAVPPGVDAKAQPRWRKISSSPQLRWHDHRIPLDAADDAAPVSRFPTDFHRISSWTVTLQYGGQQLSASGELDWVPGPNAAVWLALCVLLMAIVGCVLPSRGHRWIAAALATLVDVDVIHSALIAAAAAGGTTARLSAFIATTADVPVVSFAGKKHKGRPGVLADSPWPERKIDQVMPLMCRAGATGRSQVVAIGVVQEYQRVFTGSKDETSTGAVWFSYHRTERRVTCYYFYLLEHTDCSDPIFGNNRARVIAAGRPLLAAAQCAHEVRDGLTLEQVLDMVIAIATIHGDTRYLEPILQTALDGLRPPTEVRPA